MISGRNSLKILMVHSRHQVSLELVEINVEGAVETEGGGDGGHDLGDEAVEVGEGGGNNAQLLLANIVDSLVINLARYQHMLVSAKTSENEP